MKIRLNRNTLLELLDAVEQLVRELSDAARECNLQEDIDSLDQQIDDLIALNQRARDEAFGGDDE